jgi:hypothetical protein
LSRGGVVDFQDGVSAEELRAGGARFGSRRGAERSPASAESGVRIFPGAALRDFVRFSGLPLANAASSRREPNNS